MHYTYFHYVTAQTIATVKHGSVEVVFSSKNFS